MIQSINNGVKPVTSQRDILARLKSSGNPLIDGNTASIYWLGSTPPDIIADVNNWEEANPIRMRPAGNRLWVHHFELPADAYIEYCFTRGRRRVADPYNSRRTPNGMGKMNNYFSMPAYRETSLNRLLPGVPQPEISTVELPTDGWLAGKKRRVHLYQPPNTSPVRLMIVYDGQDYLVRTGLPTMVQNLVFQGKIEPVALALIENGGPFRTMEYTCSEATIGFVLEYLLPAARHALNLVDVKTNPGSYAVCGASYGGLQAMYTAFRAPHVFGCVLSQSGAFSVSGYDYVIWELVKMKETKPLKLFLDCGRYEDLAAANRRMSDLLQEIGYAHLYREYHGGHNYPSWRNELEFGLRYLFPPAT